MMKDFSLLPGLREAIAIASEVNAGGVIRDGGGGQMDYIEPHFVHDGNDAIVRALYERMALIEFSNSPTSDGVNKLGLGNTPKMENGQ